MRIKQVVKYCADHGHPITSMAIYLAGKKYGFLKKIEGKYSLEFNREKFLEWFSGFTVELPSGYVTIKELAKDFNLSVPQCYILAKDESVKKMKKGTGVGVLYVDEETFGKFINIRKYGTEEHFG